jgi:hypothetical protein
MNNQLHALLALVALAVGGLAGRTRWRQGVGLYGG